MVSLMVKLSEIDAEAISSIRKIKKKTSAYKILKYAIEQDGQLNPIVIRALTDDELNNSAVGAKYGIIDGHHRYQIAKENGKESILAEIDTSSQSDYRDMELALRLNVANINMSTLEKGAIIYRLIEAGNKNPLDSMDVETIGRNLFGIKASMTYRCLNMYKKANNIPTIERPRSNEPLPSLTYLRESLEAIQYDSQVMCFNIDHMMQQLTEESINHQFQTIGHIREILKECESAFLKYRELLVESDCGITSAVDSNISE